MCTIEPADHGFDNMSRIFREFLFIDFLSLVEKLKRQINIIFCGDLNTSSSIYGYQATFEEWIEQAKVEGSGLEGGPCLINLDNDSAPICDQLWLFVSKSIDESVRIMSPLLKLAGVEEKNMSPFYKRFTSSKDLLDAYITYCPKTLSYDGMDGTTEVEKSNEIDDSEQQQAEEKNKDIANRICQFTTEILSFVNTPASVNNSVSDDEENNVVVVEKNSTEGDEISRNNKNNRTKKKIADPSALMKTFNNLVDCKSTADIFDKVISASNAIESSDRNTEQVSASCKRKVKYLLGRWYEKYEPQSKKTSICMKV